MKTTITLLLFLFACTRHKDSIRYPIPLDVAKTPKKGQGSLAEDCPVPLYAPSSQGRLDHDEELLIHSRCKVIYNNSEYCAVQLRVTKKPEGSRHVDAICSLPGNVPKGKELARESNHNL